MTSFTDTFGPRSGKVVICIPRTAHPRFLSTSSTRYWREMQLTPPQELNSGDRSFEDILASIAESSSEAIGPRGVEGVDYDRVDRTAHPRFSSPPQRLPVFYDLYDFKIALIQLAVGPDKTKNIADAVRKICKAKEKGANLVVLPECFNCLYEPKHFEEHAEHVPSGETCAALSEVAAETGMFVVGGTIPERSGQQLFNTCTIWNDRGELVARHRKKPICNKEVSDKYINDSNEIECNEPEDFAMEDRVTTFNIGRLKIGIGTYNDLRLFKTTALMAQEGCSLVIYLGAFDSTISSKQWELLGRARAIDLKMWVALVSPARDTKADCTALGRTMLIAPSGKVVASLGKRAGTLRSSIDFKMVERIRRYLQSRRSAEI